MDAEMLRRISALTHNYTTHGHDDDLITRHDALNAVREQVSRSTHLSEQERCAVQSYLFAALKSLWKVPSKDAPA
jgi:hypothetical protein